MQKVRQHKDWLSAGFQNDVPKPENNCGSIRIPPEKIMRFEMLGPGLTNDPGQFRTIIFVLSENSAKAVLQRKNAEFATYEIMSIDDHTAVEVTSVLILRESFLRSTEFTEVYLPIALGLESVAEFSRPEEEPIPTDE